MRKTEMQRGYPWEKKVVKSSKQTLHAETEGEGFKGRNWGCSQISQFGNVGWEISDGRSIWSWSRIKC